MTTTLYAEDHPIAAVALIVGTVLTFTSSGDEAITLSGSDLADSSQIIDPLPPPGSRVDAAVYEFAKSVSNLPEVMAMTHARDGAVNLLWTFIRHRDRATRSRVYAQERQLMDRYPDLTFNFNVASLDQGAALSLMQTDLKNKIVMCRLAQG